MVDEPSANVFLWNDPNEQRILIESDRTSFGDSKAVARILQNGLNRKLAPHYLAVQLTIEIEQSEFWQLVKRFEGQITELEFRLLYPNLPKAHSTISDELEEAFKSIGSVEGAVKFKAEQGDTLRNIDESNPDISSLNNAASLQGMPISLKIKKKRKKIKTGKATKYVTVTEIISNDKETLRKIAEKYFRK